MFGVSNPPLTSLTAGLHVVGASSATATDPHVDAEVLQ